MISLIDLVSICGVATMTAAGASRGLHLLRRRRRHDEEGELFPRSPQEEPSGRPARGAWHEPRYHRRHPVSCPIEYVVDGMRNEGTLLDMCQGGWRAQGLSPVPNGTAMQVRILFPSPAQCVTIDEAVVRWTDGLVFGVEVTHISAVSAATLREYLNLHYPIETHPAVYS